MIAEVRERSQVPKGYRGVSHAQTPFHISPGQRLEPFLAPGIPGQEPQPPPESLAPPKIVAHLSPRPLPEAFAFIQNPVKSLAWSKINNYLIP